MGHDVPDLMLTNRGLDKEVSVSNVGPKSHYSYDKVMLYDVIWHIVAFYGNMAYCWVLWHISCHIVAKLRQNSMAISLDVAAE